MGAWLGRCCRVRQVPQRGAAGGERPEEVDEFLPPSTAAERRRRGVATTSLDVDTLKQYARDETRPRRAEHAAAELLRRGEAR